MSVTAVPHSDRAAAASERSSRLRAEQLCLGYDDRPVVDGLDLAVPEGAITAIVGPNACGKSTLLRGLSRLLTPERGSVVLDGQDLHRLAPKEVARRLGLLPQSPTAPAELSVEDLVSRGRYPYQTFFKQWSADDRAAVDDALARTHTEPLRHRPVASLSGGQRQRVWIALTLAQQTPILLLDEPTTFLDIAHRLDVLELLADLNATDGRTVVMVLHELNEACRYAHHLVAMRDGQVVAAGTPAEVVTPQLVESVFDLPCRVIDDPETHTPLIIPRADARRHKDIP